MSDLTIQQFSDLIEDCLSAISNPISALSKSLKVETQQLVKTFDYEPLQSKMSIIEQETDREGDEPELEREECRMKAKVIKMRFNSQVGQLKEINTQMNEVINAYKVLIQEMAQDLLKKEKQLHQSKLKSSRNKNTTNSKSQPIEPKDQDHQQKARTAPSPFPEQGCSNCLILNERLQTLEKEKTNWKSLSAKIDDCKKKLQAYEVQIKEKDSQLETLRGKSAQSQSKDKHIWERSEEEKRRLKKDNTTLRGEKVLLNNQVAALKRQLAQQTALTTVQEDQLTRLRKEVSSLNNSFLSQAAALEDLRAGVTESRRQESRDIGQQMQGLVRINQALLIAIGQQEEVLLQLNTKTRQIQEGWTQSSYKAQQRIMALEAMVQDKNETIIRLKTGKGERSQGGGYHAQMVRVLNKRLAEREERVRVLEESLTRIPIE